MRKITTPLLVRGGGRLFLWMGALIVGVLLGLLNNGVVNEVVDFTATVYVRLFQLVAVPTIVLAVTTTLATLGKGNGAGRIFAHTLTYTLLTTAVAAAVGLLLYVSLTPAQASPLTPLQGERGTSGEGVFPLGGTERGLEGAGALSYKSHLLSVVPDNIVRPMLEGNVLSLLLLAAAVGLALSRMPQSDGKTAVLNLLNGLQELLFTLIRALIWTLPLGIVAFAAQLATQLSAGVVAESLGKYVLVVLGGNVIQFFVVLPLFLLARGINPLRTLRGMMPAVLMALFTKSSAATLPVTMRTAEERLHIKPQIARFVLPLCTTINMNGCAAFILVTSLFTMQQGGTELTWTLMLTWLLISVISAVGNAGVPMGCYFLTLSLMSGIGAPVAVLGLILPIYTIIDMIETAVNVWSDSCVATMTDRDID